MWNANDTGGVPNEPTHQPAAPDVPRSSPASCALMRSCVDAFRKPFATALHQSPCLQHVLLCCAALLRYPGPAPKIRPVFGSWSAQLSVRHIRSSTGHAMSSSISVTSAWFTSDCPLGSSTWIPGP